MPVADLMDRPTDASIQPRLVLGLYVWLEKPGQTKTKKSYIIIKLGHCSRERPTIQFVWVWKGSCDVWILVLKPEKSWTNWDELVTLVENKVLVYPLVYRSW